MSRKEKPHRCETTGSNKTFKNIIFSSVFEKEVAQYLSSCKICWERNEKKFPTFIDGSLHHYVPDFYLPDFDLYIEVKGIFHTAAKKRKTFKAVVDNNLRWVIIYMKEWKIRKHILKERIDSYKDTTYENIEVIIEKYSLN